LDDLEGQYCKRNCIGCSASSLATAGVLFHWNGLTVT